ncbi:DUF3168 domain-containing protein [Dongia sp.]|uniref:tail completion protein gp17 n=1 Tax=Dongia sp. TaxID=1977262 RepID=UPI0035AFC49E
MDIIGTLEAALMAALTGDSPPAFTEAPIWANEAPQTQEAAFVVYRIVSETPWVDLEGETGTDQARVQFDVQAATYQELVAISRALRSALRGIGSTDPDSVIQSVTYSNKVDFLEETTNPKLHRRSLDFVVTCNPSL